MPRHDRARPPRPSKAERRRRRATLDRLDGKANTRTLSTPTTDGRDPRTTR